MNNSTPLPLGAKIGKGKRSKSSVYFESVDLKSRIHQDIEFFDKLSTEEINPLIDDFIKSKSTDDQITVMKKLIDSLKNNVQENVVKFIVIVIVESEARHPVKCLLMRQLEKWTDIHEMFIKLLSKEIVWYFDTYYYGDIDYEIRSYLIPRLDSCLENFSLGFEAVKLIENNMLKWLLDTLMVFLREIERNEREIYQWGTDLSSEVKLKVSEFLHQCLRLLLQVFQRVTIVDESLKDSINDVIHELTLRSKVTMDSKCLGAMFNVAVLKCEGKHPWDKFGENPEFISNAPLWRSNETNQLCFYYALFSNVPSNVIDLLDYEYSNEAKQMFHDMVQKVVDITDRISDSVDATMAGARTVAIVASRLAAASETGLNELESNETGLNEPGLNKQGAGDTESNQLGTKDPGSNESEPNACKEKNCREASLHVALLVERCLTSLAAHVAAAPRQLAAQAQVDLLNYYLQHHPQEGSRWVCSGGLGAEGLGRLRRAVEAGRRRGRARAGTALVAPAVLLPALADTHTMLQASSLLSTYISVECECLEAELVHQRWVQPALALLAARGLNHDTLDHLVTILATAIDINNALIDYILPLIKRPEAIHADNIKCTLLLMRVILKSKIGKKYQDTEDKWKGIIPYTVLEQGILHGDDQVVSMTLSVGLVGGVSGGQRTLWTLLRTHAHRAVATHTRTLHLIQQFLKRVETEYRTAKRKDPNYGGDKGENCLQFVERLRQLCFSNLVPGGNHNRRGICLFVLKQIHSLQLEQYHWSWTQFQVDTVLRHIDDTYDTNRRTAFDILQMCPQNLVKDGMTSSGITSVENIVSTCGALARDAGGAALRVELLLATAGALPPDPRLAAATDRHQVAEQTGTLDRQLEAGESLTMEQNCGTPDRQQVTELTDALDRQLQAGQDLTLVETSEPSDRQEVTEQARTLDRQLVAEKCLQLAQTSPSRASALRILKEQLKHLPLSSSIWNPAEALAMRVLDLAAPLVEAASPEGYVPKTFFDTPVKPHPESKYLFTVGDEVMTPQTMLLNAWTSAKEAWCIVCEVCVATGARSHLLLPLGARLLRLRHRALLDCATADYATVLQHYHTVCETTQETEEITEAFIQISRIVKEEILSYPNGDSTRRGGGLTSLAVTLAATCEPWCRLVSHHVSKGICRQSQRAAHVAAALLRAKKLQRIIHLQLQNLMLEAFEQLDSANTEMQWSCAGVVSAGARRALGPPGAPHTLRTTVFASRYPLLYERITECVRWGQASGGAALAGALLVLGRLRGDGGAAPPPGMDAAAGSPAHHIRRMAAAAAAAALPHNKYLEHTTEVLKQLSDPKIVKNLCHGLILRLIALLESAPELEWSEAFAPRLSGTLWVMETACYPLVHEYINLAMLLHNKYPDALSQEYRSALGAACVRIALGPGAVGPGAVGPGAVGPGGEACAGAAVTAAHALLPPALASHTLDAALRTNTYEVCLASLKCYLSTPRSERVIDPSQLVVLYTSHPHPECRRLSLQLLVEHDLLENIVEKPPSNISGSDIHNWKLLKLYEKWDNAVENERSLFLEGIRRTLSAALKEEDAQGEGTADEEIPSKVAEDTKGEANTAAQGEATQDEATLGERAARAIASAMFASSALTAGQEERDAADALLQEHAEFLLEMSEDDDDLFVAMCIFGAWARQAEGGRSGEGGEGGGGGGGGGGAEAVVRRAQSQPALLLALALLDFAVPVQEPDETSQYRAFSRSWDPEVAEEGVWTARAAPLLALEPALAALGAQGSALRHVCGEHLDHFTQLVQDPRAPLDQVNPKVVYLVDKLREIVFKIPNNAN